MTALAPLVEADATSKRWTKEHVWDLIVKARLAFNGVGLMVSGGTPGRVSGVRAEIAGASQATMFSPSVLKVFHWLRVYAKPEEMIVLHEYLKWRAGGYPDHSLADIARGHGWTEDRVKYVRKAFCKRVAESLHERGVPWFDLTPDGAVILP